MQSRMPRNPDHEYTTYDFTGNSQASIWGGTRYRGPYNR